MRRLQGCPPPPAPTRVKSTLTLGSAAAASAAAPYGARDACVEIPWIVFRS